VPQPRELEPGIAALVRLYEDAQARMGTELAEALGGRETAKAARLRSLLSAVDREVDALQDAHRLYLSDGLLAAYRIGAQEAAAAAGHDVVWTQLHREAVQALAVTNWGEVLAHTKYLRNDTKKTLRTLARSAAARTLLGEKTASGAGRALAEAVRKEAGIMTIRYRNGARHAVADWADTSARTSSALAFNEGTFVQAAQDGIRWMECFDGPDCGLEAHGQAPFANGMVLSLADARANPIAHPRCARSWAPRPDAKGPDRSGRTPDAFEAAEAERARAATRLVSGAPRGKFSVAKELQRAGTKPPRTPRTPRAAAPKAPPKARAPRTPRKATAPKQPAPPQPVAVKPGPVGRSIDEFTHLDPKLPPKVRQAVDHAQEQMAKVHGYGDAQMNPSVKVVGEGLDRRLVPADRPDRVLIRELARRTEASGEYQPSRGNNPLFVQIKRMEKVVDPDSMKTATGKVRYLEPVPDPGTVAHELGHWADISMMTGEGETWASRYAWKAREINRRLDTIADPEDLRAVALRETLADIGTKDPEAMRAFGKVFDAITESPTYKKTTGIGGDFWDKYANTPEELWARAYAQWITDRSGSTLMRERLDADLLKRNKPLADKVGYGHEQWTWDEFGPIADAIDDLMKALGWLT
jgi:hypothetical protein